MSWDDGEYVMHNRDIQGLGHLSDWFSKYYIGNYHPLTMLSYAIDYSIGGLQPWVYHVGSLLLHTANAILVYLFFRRLQPNSIVAVWVALLFAVHPVQTESVSWIAERKTVLCGFFYLLALWQYVRYADKPTAGKLIGITIAGLAAMLSKGTGVTLPLALIATDIWLGRDLKSRKVWLEKLPLFVISLIVGVVAIKAQASAKFLNLHPEYGIIDSIVYAGYAYVHYIVRLLVPVQLSVIYPYPKELGIIHYLCLLIAIGILALGVVAYRKRSYVLCGGIAFYTANIILFLQFVQFGEALSADRYVYIASLGVLYPLVYYVFAWCQNRSRQVIAVAVTGMYAVALSAMTFVRNDIWLSDLNFFNAILETFPNSAVAQYSVGTLYMKMGDYEEADRRLSAAVQVDPNNYKAWHSRGMLYLRQGKAMQALDALNKSLELKENTKAYFTRAMLYEGTGKPELAIADIDKVLEEQPENGRAWYIKGDCQEQLGNTNGALESYSKAIEYEATEPLFYIRRGLIFSKMQKDAPALEDLNRAVELKPNNGNALYYRAIVKYRSKQSPCADLQAAAANGYKGAREAMEKLCK
jgi:tetratricopeptide (TPR) repeat protein